MGYNQIKDQLPPTIDVACHNSNISCTLSGPANDMEQYVNGLKEKELFAKLVNVANIAYHSRYIKSAAPVLLKYLQEVSIFLFAALSRKVVHLCVLQKSD